MYHITGEYAKNNFSEVLEKASTEPGGVVIVQENKSFILISQEELESWIETAKLLQDKTLIADIEASRQEYNQGEVFTL
ncbi:type II toxin-antitoxin system Phd/YefM family antitoxin [Planktothrix agardhii 1801]|jgi:prevent-host-death family protein|uniref:type II toxin-antitoxin system Phd/YefM family antitoxin n=1 Tax=Planktothrix agardhii TaxID=1160 RepID=UPI001F32AA13|nr:type II toxin-antitoxin system prevent-host-death family antitoxin [Planktothrix agardhii]MCF3624262.1 type II toxin-antitoxin system Phd/YefM family antitoxin [Planktothrix agardhii 1801]